MNTATPAEPEDVPPAPAPGPGPGDETAEEDGAANRHDQDDEDGEDNEDDGYEPL